MTEETYIITISLTTLLGVKRTVTREKYSLVAAMLMVCEFEKQYTVHSWSITSSDGRVLFEAQS